MVMTLIYKVFLKQLNYSWLTVLYKFQVNNIFVDSASFKAIKK